MAEPTMSSKKNIVILGGSFGGVSAAHYALKHAIPPLPEKESYQVVLVSASSQAMLRQACPRALISDEMFPQDKLFISIPKQFEQYLNESFRFVHGSVTGVDHNNRNIVINLRNGNTETLEYHALVIATGASTPSPLLGLNEDAGQLKTSWAAFRKALPQAKNIVIAGGGPAGVETAGELGEYLNGRAGLFASKLEKPKVPITIVTASKILPALRPVIADKAERYLAKVGATIEKGRIVAVEREDAGSGSSNQSVAQKTKVQLDDGSVIDADLYIPATGVQPNTSFLRPELLTNDNRVDTNEQTLRVEKAGPRVYAVGDCASYSRPAVHLILNAIPILGANLKRDLLLAAGKQGNEVPAERTYKLDTSETQLVPIGKSKGVGAAMGYQLPSWLVWLIKGRDYWLWTTGNLWSGKQWAKET